MEKKLVGKRVALLRKGGLQDYLITEDHGSLACGCHQVDVAPDPVMHFAFDGNWAKVAVGSATALCGHIEEAQCPND